MLRRSFQAVLELQKHGAHLTFTDILEEKNIRQSPPPGCDYFNVSVPQGRANLRCLLRGAPLTHIYIANWPDVHLLTAVKYSENCPGGTIVVAKPLDTNFQLIETIGRGGFPGIQQKIFVHDHYLTKSVVERIFKAFPKLIGAYGEIQQFEFYLVEYKTIEDENRLDALKDGVIFDLMSHLVAVAQLFFLMGPRLATLQDARVQVTDVKVLIRQVARGRYIRCHLADNVETFAAVDLKVIVTYNNKRTHSIPGLLVVGKGIKPTESVEADVKGIRLKFALNNRTANFSSGIINPPLTDLAVMREPETGFYRPIVTSLSSHRPDRSVLTDDPPVLMNFEEARDNASFLKDVIELGKSNLVFYQAQQTTLRDVIARCVGAGSLDSRWLPVGEFSDVGYTT
jgi:hypothetical protein